MQMPVFLSRFSMKEQLFGQEKFVEAREEKKPPVVLRDTIRPGSPLFNQGTQQKEPIS